MKDTLPPRVRFGVFELHLKTGELHQGEERILLQEQPFQVLLMLVERDGEIATREEIKRKLWPNDTIVEFDHSINAAIKNLRRALGDSATEPKFIETIARRGYRLMVPVEWMEGPTDRSSDDTLSGDGTTVRGQPPPGALTGRTVSHYRVLDVIGGGGMGVLYRAEDLKLGRRVALKFLPEELGSDPKALERFSREARAASALDHPNICHIYEFGEHEGYPFIVMQLLEGHTLRDRLTNAPQGNALPLSELLDIAIQVSDGLQAAHEKGIIHRDIKPANIFLTSKGVCKVLDFGLAKLLEGGEEDEVAPQPDDSATTLPLAPGVTHLTRTGIAMGTAGYMSPEQIRGEKLDARTDIFSFGLVLYEMATGQRAFSGDTAAILQDAILKHMPIPVHEINPTVPAKLEHVILRALEKDRDLRYECVSEIRADLQQLKREESEPSVSSMPIVQLGRVHSGTHPAAWETPVPAAQKPHVTLRKLLLGLAALLVLPLVTIIFYRGQSTKRASQPIIKSLAVLPLKNISGDPSQDYFTDGMTEELIGRLSGLRDLRVISRTSVMGFKDTKLPLPKIAKTLNVDAIVEGSVVRDGNRIRIHARLIRGATNEDLWSEEYDRDLKDVLALQSELAQSIAGKIEATVTGKERGRLVVAHPVSPEAYESSLKGWFTYNHGNSKADVEKSISYFQDAIKIDPTYAPPYLGLGHAYLSLGSNMFGDSPKEAHQKAVSAAQKALELDPELADAHLLLAQVKYKQYQWAEAETEYKRALELAPNDATAHFALAYWLSWQGRAEEALAWARRGRELDPISVSGEDIGVILYNARRYDEAAREYRGVLAVQPDDVNTLWSLGILLIATHQPGQSIPLLEKAVSISKGSPGVMGSLVAAYAQAGRRGDALRLLAELKKRKQAGSAGAFVHAYLGLGDYDQTFYWLEQAYREESNILQHLKVDALFDPVSDDPRFQDLIRRVGLDQPR